MACSKGERRGGMGRVSELRLNPTRLLGVLASGQLHWDLNPEQCRATVPARLSRAISPEAELEINAISGR